MLTGPKVFLALLDACGLQPCDRTHLKNGPVPNRMLVGRMINIGRLLLNLMNLIKAYILFTDNLFYLSLSLLLSFLFLLLSTSFFLSFFLSNLSLTLSLPKISSTLSLSTISLNLPLSFFPYSFFFYNLTNCSPPSFFTLSLFRIWP